MKHSLYYKFILGYLVFGLLGFASIATFSARLMNKNQVKNQAEAMYDEANLIASAYSSVYQGKKQDLDSVYPQLQAVAKFVRAEIWVVNRQGIIVVDSEQNKRAGTAIEGFDPTATGNKSYCTGAYYGLFPYDVLSVSAPITGNYNTYGYVLVHLPMSVIWEMSNSNLNVVYITAAILFILSLIILLVFTKTVYFPLQKITEGANEYAAGNLEYRIDLNTRDEMGYLAGTLNYMSGELNKLEEYQRNFIANVSHDFRSPLTSIKGYIEAMLDGTIPPELQNKYLNIILFETERLTKLTQGILDLNRFGQHRGMMLDLTDFDINRMIKTTILTFEGTCSAKGLSFDLVLTGQKLYVHGDMSKIQQVLYNLIDNATKFSHNDASIKIETSIKNEKVLISVKDSGIGIPAESIKKIWDRFYKTDLSRGKDKRGTGLGLAIVKEIIQAHNEHINVISTEGVGTEFIFTLPLAKKEVQS